MNKAYVAVILVLVAVAFLTLVVVSPIYAFGDTMRMTGTTGLEIREEKLVGNEKYTLLALPGLDLDGDVPPGYKPLFAVKDPEGRVFVVLADAKLREHVLLVSRGDGYSREGLVFEKVSEQVIRSGPSVQKVETKDGKVEEMVGVSECRLVEEKASFGAFQVARVYFDCHYTTQLGGLRLATTHSRGYVYYIPGDKVTAVVDMSYDAVHSPVVRKCWFRHTYSGVGTPAVSVTAQGKYLLCYSLTSTKWTQKSWFVFDVYGLKDCRGSHTAWADMGCDC